MEDLKFTDHFALSRLPYFDVKDGSRICLSDPQFGPTVDAHTHLALGYAGWPRVDLRRRHPRTEHYLPLGRPLDLDVYMNRNFRPTDLKRLTRDLTVRSVTAGGMRRTHTAPNLLAEMSDLGIVASVILPIELPFLSRNAEAYLAVAQDYPALIPFGSVHPYEFDPVARLHRQKAQGARGVKIHPAVQMIYPHDRRAMRIYRAAGANRLPILWHCGPVGIETPAGRRRSQVVHYERPIAENPETVFLLGHSGALQPETALDLASRYPNVWLELASQSLSVIRRILERGPVERVVTGSDWPFYHQATALAKVLIATEGDPGLRHQVLYENAARLFGLPHRNPGDLSTLPPWRRDPA